MTSKYFNRYLLIPLVVNLLTLFVVPEILDTLHFGKAAFLLLVVFSWPWIMYFVVGSVMENVIEEIERRRK